MKRLLALVFLSFLINVSAYTIENDDCSVGGPAYWCTSKENAAACKATAYCKEHVWKTQAKGDNDLCASCEKDVDMLHELVLNKQTQIQIMNFIKQQCTTFPQALQQTCNEFVDVYGTKIIAIMVKATADSKKVCTQAGFCSSNSANSIAAAATNIKNVGSDYCLTCQQYIGTIHMLLSNAQSKQALISELKQACSSIPSPYGGICTEVVSLFAAEGIDWLVNYTGHPIQFCSLIGICKTFVPLLQGKPLLYKFNIPAEHIDNGLHKSNVKIYCDGCDLLFELIQVFLNDSSIEKLVKESLENLCSYMPAEIFSRCLDYMVHHEEQIYVSIVEHLKPNRTCSFLCQMKGPQDYREVFAEILKMVEKIFEKAKSEVMEHWPQKKEVTCELCTLAMTKLVDILEGKETKEEIKEALDHLCDILPSYTQNECNTLMNSYSDQLVDLIIDEIFNPVDICKKIKLCGTTSKKAVVEKKVKAVQGVTCELCTLAMSELERTLEGNNTKDEVRAALDMVCGFLPKDLTAECKQLVTMYSDEIIDLLVKDLSNPNAVCKQLGLCKSAYKVKPRAYVECEVCTIVIGYLDKLLEGKKEEAAIQEALDKLCSYVPGKYEAQCTSLVNSYSKEIINIIVNEFADPASLCAELGLCTKTKAIIKRMEQNKKAVDFISCEICDVAIGKLDQMLKDKSTEEEIKTAIEQLCSHLPSALVQECDLLVKQYGDMIFDMLSQELDPSTFCKAMGLCKSTELKVKKLMDMRLKNPVLCEVCENAMGYLDSVLKEKSTEAEIKKEVEAMCSKLPQSLGSECNALVAEYGDQIIKLIAQEMAPTLVCKELKLC